MTRNALHMAIGVAWLFTLVAALVFWTRPFWTFQAVLTQRLLDFAKVPYRLLLLPVIDLSRGIPVYYRPGGRTFVVPVEYSSLKPGLALLVILLLVILGLAFYQLKRIALPIRVSFLFLLVLVVSTILYTSFVSPVPPHAVNRLSIDWQYSGAVVLLLASLIFVFSVFPVKGPLWIKFGWLFGMLVYGIIWNVVRISVVLSTLYHLGSMPFLLTHYLTGIYIDFIYIVAFYSLALSHLARREVSEVGW